MDNEAIETLRAFALAHNEVAFAHVCGSALAGEEWAVDRIMLAIAPLVRTLSGPLSGPRAAHAIQVIRAIDTSRPDGLVARTLTDI